MCTCDQVCFSCVVYVSVLLCVSVWNMHWLWNQISLWDKRLRARVKTKVYYFKKLLHPPEKWNTLPFCSPLWFSITLISCFQTGLTTSNPRETGKCTLLEHERIKVPSYPVWYVNSKNFLAFLNHKRCQVVWNRCLLERFSNEADRPGLRFCWTGSYVNVWTYQ